MIGYTTLWSDCRRPFVIGHVLAVWYAVNGIHPIYVGLRDMGRGLSENKLACTACDKVGLNLAVG